MENIKKSLSNQNFQALFHHFLKTKLIYRLMTIF